MHGWFKNLVHRTRALDIRLMRRIVVGIIGFTVLLIGVALLVLPGPAVVVIPMGLAILATEFLWAKRWLNKAKSMLKRRFYKEEKVETKNEEQKSVTQEKS